MARPQSNELYRSGTTPALEPDSVESELRARRRGAAAGPAGPVPEANQPGHRPDHPVDQPDPDAVAEALGTVPPSPDGPGGVAGRARTLARDAALVAVGAGVLVVGAIWRRVRR